jgi:two-component system, OmpR family, response regulator
VISADHQRNAPPADELLEALFKAEAVKRASVGLGFERGTARFCYTQARWRSDGAIWTWVSVGHLLRDLARALTSLRAVGSMYATAHTVTSLLAILAVMPQSPSLRVLLIEDSALLAARLSELVNRLPEVDLIDTVDTEADALDRISAGSPDVLILDLHLREGSGFGVLRSLALSTRPRPKIIVLTNFGLPEYRREAELFGVEAFLDKAREYFRLPSLLTGFAKEHAVQDPH